MAPPKSTFDAIDDDSVRALIPGAMDKKYRKMIDRESAFEILEEKLTKIQEEAEAKALAEEKRKEDIRRDQDESRAERQKRRNKSELEKAMGKMANQTIYSMSRTLGNRIMRGILGGIFGGKKR